MDETADDDLWRELATGQDAAALPEDAAPEAAPPTPFTISDEATAAWAVGKINAARAVLAQREQAAAAWVEEARREVQRLETRFVPELQQWASQHLPKGKRSLKLRSGTLAFRTKPARFKLDNPEEALPWAKLYLPDAVVVKESLAVAVLFDYAKTGEVPPGVTFLPASESFTIS